MDFSFSEEQERFRNSVRDFYRGLRGVASYIVGAEGTQNIMRLIIAREILGKDFAS